MGDVTINVTVNVNVTLAHTHTHPLSVCPSTNAFVKLLIQNTVADSN